jgi:hypothetical protein
MGSKVLQSWSTRFRIRHFTRVGTLPGAPKRKGQGEMMTRKLSDADRTAVDLVLDRLQAAGANGNGGDASDVVMVSQSVSDERLSAVERVLSALDAMPAGEPPAAEDRPCFQRVGSPDDATRHVY